jgi:hypothetical protein
MPPIPKKELKKVVYALQYAVIKIIICMFAVKINKN